MRCRLLGFLPRALIVAVVCFPFVLAAQNATLSGTATDAKGRPLPNAAVTLKPAAGAPLQVHADANGNYSIPNLAPGNYTLSATSDGLRSREISVTINDVPHQTVDLMLSGQELPNAPAAAPQPQSPSLEDLGFSSQQTQGNARLQATLEKRTHMLKVHQKLGLITAIPMAAALITGPEAKVEGRRGGVVKVPTDANLDFHAALGGLTTAMYFTTAYYAVFAPRVPGTRKHGGIRWHEALAFVHGSGMIVTPVLGAMAYKQETSGEKAHGIAAQHGTVAYITAIAYGTSIVAVSWPIHWKVWDKQ